jgi:uncharacterized protein YndB with AHSA1/START domain
MTVVALRKSPETQTMTIDIEASAERVWQLWADPRQLERWWGPPSYPATFTRHDLTPGSRIEYHMTGPTGDQPRGYWDIIATGPPRSLVFHQGLAKDDGTPNDAIPRHEARVAIEGIGQGRTRMSIQFQFPSAETMEQMIAMRMDEGIEEAVGQIDAILAEGVAV